MDWIIHDKSIPNSYNPTCVGYSFEPRNMRYDLSVQPFDLVGILGEDGYVRLNFQALESVEFVHLMSRLDEDSDDTDASSTDLCVISGYTEWISTTAPAITIGWDWQLEVSQVEPQYVSVGLPRSNIMLLDGEQRDLGPDRTGTLVKIIVDSLRWQVATTYFIGARYAATIL